MLHLLSLTEHNPNAKEGYRWVIECAVRPVWSSVKAAFLFLCWLAVTAGGIPNKLYFPYIPTCLEGVSAVRAVRSEMRMTSWDREQNEGCQSSAVLDLMKKDKRLHTGQNNVWCTGQAGITVFDGWTGKWLGNQNKFLCDSALPLWSALLLTCCCESKWCCTPCSMGNTCLQTAISCVLKLNFIHIFLIFTTLIPHTLAAQILWVLCAFCTVGGVMGI